MMQRRGFLKLLAAGCHAAVAALVGVPAFRFLTDPLRKKSKNDSFLRAVPLASLSAEKPARVMLEADRVDAFIHHPPGPMGSVWLTAGAGERASAGENGGGTKCLQVICPHLGCGIEYAADRKAFYCPCHDSEFDLSGKRRFGPSPRDMDELPIRISQPDEQGVRWVEVQYAEFQTGIAEKKPMV